MNPVKGFKLKPWKVQTVLGINTFLCKFQISGAKDSKSKNISFRNLTKYSSEILFEIWDQSKKSEKFLGLGIGKSQIL